MYPIACIISDDSALRTMITKPPGERPVSRSPGGVFWGFSAQDSIFHTVQGSGAPAAAGNELLSMTGIEEAFAVYRGKSRDYDPLRSRSLLNEFHLSV